MEKMMTRGTREQCIFWGEIHQENDWRKQNKSKKFLPQENPSCITVCIAPESLLSPVKDSMTALKL